MVVDNAKLFPGQRSEERSLKLLPGKFPTKLNSSHVIHHARVLN